MMVTVDGFPPAQALWKCVRVDGSFSDPYDAWPNWFMDEPAFNFDAWSVPVVSIVEVVLFTTQYGPKEMPTNTRSVVYICKVGSLGEWRQTHDPLHQTCALGSYQKKYLTMPVSYYA